MAHIKTFQDLQVWGKAHQLTLLIYTYTAGFPETEKFGLVSQMRRAAVSVGCNIVEGFRKKSLKDSLRFYNIADSSLEELKYQLLLSKDLQLITDNEFNAALALTEEVSKMLYSWSKTQREFQYLTNLYTY